MTASCLTEDGGMWGSWLLTDPSAECLNSLVHLWTRQLLCLSLCQSEFGHVELLKYLTRRASKACQCRYPFSNRCYERRAVSICTSLHTSVEHCVGPFQLRGSVCVINDKTMPPLSQRTSQSHFLAGHYLKVGRVVYSVGCLGIVEVDARVARGSTLDLCMSTNQSNRLILFLSMSGKRLTIHHQLMLWFLWK